ncbi:TolC family protein [Bdellovibrio svalbardensis]|uniref:TolC family protein n=1 Tax=Bdellovibrio svalbardensis TaxID=2972972 RepID=A0ABT6DS62_9BACT|nr:TolC family protein [Bdellovibrio svalbardensis]MDG0817998.1 TolC family protein [Bdellovibrio svalbardensis]
MVKSFLFLLSTTVLNFSWAATEPSPQPAPLATATGKDITLTQKLVAELALSQGYRTKEVNLQYQTFRLNVAQTMSAYDWIVTAETGYQYEKPAGLLSSGTSQLDNKYQQYKTSIALNKPFTTGTLLGVQINRLSQQADLDPVITNPPPTNQTTDSVGIILEQSLWQNFFGTADRATVNSANYTYTAQEILRANDLEDVVLEAIRQYWTTFAAQENFKEAIVSRDRYKKLVDAVKRKTSLGYSNPGDLPQAQAEFETREQAVKTASTSYLNNLTTLITLLNLDPAANIKFEATTLLPNVPKLPAKNIEDLRTIRSQKLKVAAANENLDASKSKSHPTLNLVGQAVSEGWGEGSQDSYSQVVSSNRPKYYIGLKFKYNFGSDVQNEDIINKKINKDLEETRLSLSTLNAQDLQNQAERRVQETYALALSAEKQKTFREKAAQELNRSYSQGRTDISILITAMNNFVTAEVQFIQAVGNYHIALNEWAATRDELIPDAPKSEAQ